MDGVQFILGRSGTGKTRWCIEAICEALRTPSPLLPIYRDWQGENSLILLVPEQATYQAERAILSHPGIRGFSRLRILSFNRLQFQLDAAAAGGAEISRLGKRMVLQKLLAEHAARLTLYGGPAQQAGLADKLAGLFEQLQAADCTPEQVQGLASSLAAAQGQAMAAAKWGDIALLYQAYLDFFKDSHCPFANPDIRLKSARQKVAQAGFLQDAVVWVDGFSGFSVQERDLLVELVKVSRSASIALCLDPKAMDLSNTDDEKLDPLSLFATTEQTYTTLLRIFQGLKLPCREPVILDEPRRFDDAPPLTFLEAHAFDLERAPKASGAGNIRIAACSTVRAEAVWVARVIRKLVKDRQMRYRDIAVVVPEMQAYAHYIASAFAAYGVPFFLDRPRTMKNHPVAAMLGAAMQAAATGFAMGDVLSFLKSDLAGVGPEAMDRLENYCRAFDVQYGEWVREAAWDFAPAEKKESYDEAGLDALRRRAVGPLVRLREALYGQAAITAGQFTRAIWGLLEELGVRQTLAAWAEGDAADAVYGHRQMFAKLVELLDEMGAVFGEQAMAPGVWAAIVANAFSTLTVKLIPPTADQVLVGSIERSRHPDIKAIFLVGATQKQFPVPMAGEPLLAEGDYAAAAGTLELSNPYQEQLMHRQYLTYIALTRASKYLFLSYPLLDEKGAAVVPWSGIEQLLGVFADVRPVYPQMGVDGPEAIAAEGELSQWLAAAMGKDRVSGRRQEAEGRREEIAAGILEAMGACGDASLERVAAHVRYALGYENAAVLDAGAAKDAFALPLRTSVTRLGTFAACPYQYFAKYVLRLEKRAVLRFEPLDMGLFYHAVLEAMFNTLRQRKQDWSEVPAAELAALCAETVATIRRDDPHIANFTRRSKHHAFIIDAAEQTLKDLLPTLAALSGAGVFRQQSAELKFGPGEALQLTIKRGQTPFSADSPSPTPLNSVQKGATHEKGGQSPILEFRGQIDRLDTAVIDGQAAGVVFDFKRTGRAANFAKMLYGLDLQLPVYLLAIGNTDNRGSLLHSKRMGEQDGLQAAPTPLNGVQKGATAEDTQKRCLTPLVPAGAFYLPVEGGVAAAKLSQLGQAGAAVHKARGVFDGRFAAALDTGAAGSGWNRFYNFYTTKEGEPYGSYAHSGALTPGDFAALLEFTVAKVCELAGELSGGTISITPYRLGKASPCTWCDYRALCRFDWQVNDYNILASCDKVQVLAKMKE